MSTAWKLSAFAPKPDVQAALLAHDEIEEWDFDLAISGREIDEDRPQEWVLEGWYPRKPGKAQTQALANLFSGEAPKITSEKLPDEDWVTLSQEGTPPISAGRFYVHTPDYPPADDAVNFAIPASQAFGTGQHETTAGCLEMLGAIKKTGASFLRIADIGTGTGLLGFAGMSLWPAAKCTASDIDPICAGVVEDNAAMNGVKIGAQRGAMTMVIADGMENALLQARGPYDLLIANILAGPLVELAPDFAKSVSPGGSIVVAGLLAGEQEQAVRRAYRLNRCRPVARLQRGDWAILWFRRRRGR
ncbi:50S ribosomal protein L11 methyltransferase [Erythrobacter crassostreae]|uniref:Ribosomal protein L11 methyltransferase n=1 Tax=Erythrobacter crassostreae TaxID=2828328 RepID=A0A9X1F4H2_9SPHN|nr:50S ribosomal protein L11 methyltransferase [Erythrobacter crassostrea]MBV7260085.1 50S ribosomal protein L11 methyltransferase [Erythrobacter crassostrea]